MTVVDAHQHLWDLERVSYPWLTEEHGPIFRSFEHVEIDPQLAAAGVDRTVLVQSADSAADTEYMLDVARRWPRVAGVVGWVPLDDAHAASALLDDYARSGPVVGIRHLIHTEPDEDWIVRENLADGLALLAERELTFDVVPAGQRRLGHVVALASAHPALRLVVDHLGMPPIASGGFDIWASAMRAAAEHPNVSVKLSGLGTLADPDTWTAADAQRYVDRALDLFGPHRVMFGGDWPVCVLAGGYEKGWTEIKKLIAALSTEERELVLGGTAVSVYRLSPARLGAVDA